MNVSEIGLSYRQEGVLALAQFLALLAGLFLMGIDATADEPLPFAGLLASILEVGCLQCSPAGVLLPGIAGHKDKRPQTLG